MNKVNLCWVISDGRKGHEIQSTTVADALAKEIKLYRFQSSWLQKISAPSTFALKFTKTPWTDLQPDLNHSPDLIISCGRQAAAAAKALKLKTGSKHIHILNPKGNLSDFDLLLLPRHDDLGGENVCHFTGSIHNVNQMIKGSSNGLCHGCVAVMLGNPNRDYWGKQWPDDWKKIRQLNKKVFICGSPRLSESAKEILKNTINTHNASIWLDSGGGNNPYSELICNADHFFVTADSINMMNECMATRKPVDILGTEFITSRRHLNFIHCIVEFNSNSKNNINAYHWPDPIEEIINNPKLQNLLKSPSLFSKG